MTTGGQPVPTRVVTDLGKGDLGSRRRFGRQQIVGIVIGSIGVGLIGGVAPVITTETRAFSFDAPPDSLSLGFSPKTVVVIIGIIYQ